jgi:hypothetical protein
MEFEVIIKADIQGEVHISLGFIQLKIEGS